MMNIFNRRKIRAEPTKTAIIIRDEINGDLILPDEYTAVSKKEPVKRCAHKIADLVSDMSIMLMQNGENGDRRLKNELSRKIDIMPARYMTRKNFVYKIVNDLVMTGNSIVVPKYNDDFIEELVPISSTTTSFVTDGAGGYVIKINGASFNPGEVLHFVLNPSPDEPWRGLGFTPMVYNAIDNLAQAESTKKSFLRSKWKPSIIISIDADVDEMTNPTKRKNILGSYTNETSQGEPWIIPAGELDIKTIQPLTLQDLAIQDSITLDLKTISSAMSIPSFMVGIGEYKKDEYNNFISTTIMSVAQVIQQELTRKLLRSADMYFKLNVKSLIQYDMTEKVAFVKEMVGGGMLNRNEGRCEFDYAPVDADGMNDYIVLENYIPVDKVGEQKKLKGGKDDE